jgi:hypothetical protein
MDYNQYACGAQVILIKICASSVFSTWFISTRVKLRDSPKCSPNADLCLNALAGQTCSTGKISAADYAIVFFLREVLGAIFKPLSLQIIDKSPQMVF